MLFVESTVYANKHTNYSCCSLFLVIVDKENIACSNQPTFVLFFWHRPYALLPLPSPTAMNWCFSADDRIRSGIVAIVFAIVWMNRS